MKAASPFDPEWLARLHNRASVPPLGERINLMAGSEAVGSVAIGLLDKIATKYPPDIDSLLYKKEHVSGDKPRTWWQIDGPLSQTLNHLALSIRDSGQGPGASALERAAATHVAHHWRNEQLAVNNALGIQLGTVERGAVRALGIASRAVHLVGQTPDGRFWVQQRSLNKANDPGLWDTLMGGMVSAQDTVATALVRETWEEAGLKMNALAALCYEGAITVQRPSGEDGDCGIGYMVETTDWYRCTVPDGLLPVNQDGEVAQFALLESQELVARLERDEFTLEAALILVAALSH